jgi:hypothetical protein
VDCQFAAVRGMAYSTGKLDSKLEARLDSQRKFTIDFIRKEWSSKTFIKSNVQVRGMTKYAGRNLILISGKQSVDVALPPKSLGGAFSTKRRRLPLVGHFKDKNGDPVVNHSDGSTSRLDKKCCRFLTNWNLTALLDVETGQLFYMHSKYEMEVYNHGNGAIVTLFGATSPITKKEVTFRLFLPEKRSSKGSGGIENRLNKLQSLFDRNIISQEEYKAKRAQILSEL